MVALFFTTCSTAKNGIIFSFWSTTVLNRGKITVEWIIVTFWIGLLGPESQVSISDWFDTNIIWDWNRFGKETRFLEISFWIVHELTFSVANQWCYYRWFGKNADDGVCHAHAILSAITFISRLGFFIGGNVNIFVSLCS